MAEAADKQTYPKTVIVMDTESMGLANYQPDSAKGYGVFQISALKFELAADGSMRLLDHLDMVVEPDAAIKFRDARKGAANRKRFFDDYAQIKGKDSACFQAYQQVFDDPEVGLNTHYFYLPRYHESFGQLPPGETDATPRFRPYYDHANNPDEAEAMRSRFKQAIKTDFKKMVKKLRGNLEDPNHIGELGITQEELANIRKSRLFEAQKDTTMLVYEYLNYQVYHFQHAAKEAEAAGDSSKAAHYTEKYKGLCSMRSAMCKELGKNPWLLEQIDEAHGASVAMGLPNAQKLQEKAQKVNAQSNGGQPFTYAGAAAAFSHFCEGAEHMVAHNAMFDYAIMHRLYDQARALEKKKPAAEQQTVPAFPFTLEHVTDTLAMAASEPGRLGRKNRLDALIDEEKLTKEEITALAGGEAKLAQLVESGTIHRLSADKRERKAAGHDALEDVLITAAYLQRVTQRRAADGQALLPSAAQSVLEAMGGAPGGDAPLVERAAAKKLGERHKDIEHLLGFIPHVASEDNFKGPQLVQDYFQAMHAMNPAEPRAIISPITDQGGLLFNLQKTIPALGNLRTFMALAAPAHRDAISAVYFQKEKDFRGDEKKNGFSKLVVVPNYRGSWKQRSQRGPERYVLSPFEYIASAPYLRWDSPAELQTDLESLSVLNQFITPFGARARIEAKDTPPAPGEPAVDAKNPPLDAQWVSLSAPLNGLPDTVRGARGNLAALYKCVQGMLRDDGLLPAGKAEADVLKGGVDPVDQRPTLRIERDVFLRAYDMENSKLRALLNGQDKGKGEGFGGRGGGGGT